MSIFSLQTKKHLVGWSAVLGIIISLFFTFYPRVLQDPLDHWSRVVKFGWPIWYTVIYTDYGAVNFPKFYYVLISTNLLFWIVVCLIILFLIRYFKNYKEVKSK